MHGDPITEGDSSFNSDFVLGPASWGKEAGLGLSGVPVETEFLQQI